MYFSEASFAKKMTGFIHCDVNVNAPDKAFIAVLRLQHSVLNDELVQLQHWLKLKGKKKLVLEV